ncbi:hypothetical protein CUU64_16715 [Bacillus sp. V5-8f]|nr:hypothetical protein CUU64_16715 [Bacillus sp. V5-8f]
MVFSTDYMGYRKKKADALKNALSDANHPGRFFTFYSSSMPMASSLQETFLYKINGDLSEKHIYLSKLLGNLSEKTIYLSKLLVNLSEKQFY